MTAFCKMALLVVAFAFVGSPIAAGQATSNDILVRRIDSLEKRTIELERRVEALEAGENQQVAESQAGTSRPVPPGLIGWRQIQRRMKPEAVRALLGEPDQIMAAGQSTFWYYAGGAHVSFDSQGVEGWSEPGR